MKTITREIYKCEHCNKLYQIKNACLKHELYCRRNPTYMKPCHTCKVLKKVKETVFAGYADDYGNECEMVVEVLFCEKIDCFIHPPSVKAKGNAFDMGDKLNIVMPCECKHYEKLLY